MKFSDYYLSSGSRTLSIFVGCIAALFVGIFTGWQIGLLVGCTVVILTSFVLPLVLFLQDRPYAAIKKTFKQPFLFDERVRFTVKDGTVGGFFLLTDESMIFLSLEHGDHRLELSRNDVRSVVLSENMTISVYLNEKQFVRVISGVCEELYEVLREQGWT